MARRREERWQHWRVLIGEQQSSGLTIAEFCRQRDLSPASFYAWRHKVSAASPGQEGSLLSATASAPQFVPLQLTDAVANDGHFEIELPNGIRLTVPPKFEATMLASLLQAVTFSEGGDA